MVAVWLSLSLVGCQVESPALALYEQHYRPYVIEIDSASLAAIPNLIPAYLAYRKGDYARAAEITETFTRDERELPLPMLVLGVCYLELDSFGPAERNLSIVRAHPIFGGEASWYLLMAYLKSGDAVAACNLSAEIATVGHAAYAEQARQIAIALPTCAPLL